MRGTEEKEQGRRTETERETETETETEKEIGIGTMQDLIEIGTATGATDTETSLEIGTEIEKGRGKETAFVQKTPLGSIGMVHPRLLLLLLSPVRQHPSALTHLNLSPLPPLWQHSLLPLVSHLQKKTSKESRERKWRPGRKLRRPKNRQRR